MKSINPYLNLTGHCREAMTFYKSCFGGELSFLTAGETPMCDQMPPEAREQIMHSSLIFPGGTIMATEMTMDNVEAKPQSASIALDCSTAEEASDLFGKLEPGGKVICPVGPAFWGGLFGCVTDKYGVTWLLTHNDQPNG